MYNHYFAVIMAGGGGTRLWPLSRRASPKQMLALTGDRTMFQLAVDRLEGLFPVERILVVTTEEQAGALQTQDLRVPKDNYLLEPLPRGTASVVGLAAVALQQRDPQAVMAILTADHFIGNVPVFHRLLQAAHTSALDGCLVTLGVAPTFPSTGYGYIQSGEPLGVYDGLEVFTAQRFTEKPDEATARAMLAAGGYSWNSGMFVWRLADIMGEFERQMPALAAQLGEISAVWNTPTGPETLRRVWPTVQVQSIDYGVMEGARRVAVIPAAGLGWNDIGSWESLFDVIPASQDGNVIANGPAITLETRNTLIFQSGNRLVAAIGVEDLIIVDSGDALLVCRKDQAQKVKQVVEKLKKENLARYL